MYFMLQFAICPLINIIIAPPPPFISNYIEDMQRLLLVAIKKADQCKKCNIV